MNANILNQLNVNLSGKLQSIKDNIFCEITKHFYFGVVIDLKQV